MVTLNSKPRSTTVVAGAILALFPVAGFMVLSLHIVSIPYGPLIYPLPLVTAIPAIFLGSGLGEGAMFLAAFVPSLIFWLWGAPLFRGEAKLPLRSILFFWLLVALTFLYFGASWEYGVRWQGNAHLLGVAVLNVVAMYVVWRLLSDASSNPSFRHNLVFHWALFAWLAWLAFPWLGEGL